MRANSAAAPMLIAECEDTDEDGWGQILDHFLTKKAPNGLLQATCSVFPEKRLIWRATIEPQKLKDANYLSEFAASQFRIKSAGYTLGMINSGEGSDYNTVAASQKDVMIVGMPKQTISELQDMVLEEGIYPDRLELGTLACLGALADYLKFNRIKSPVVVLELEINSAHSYIVSVDGVEASRLLPHGLNSMIPVVQKELGLKDEESAKKLFFSNTFDFTGMGPALIKRLLHDVAVLDWIL
ncbi:MAG: hypothetical protein J6386_08960 [Candidatus Synoicihabitans palmerolidicus]|nr:hypothetical protein [Candidatus Synoicihabitans palmerolidicus]